MIPLDPETLRKVQLTELEMLIELDRICRLRNIRYNLIAGTFLGAVRHGGFIPWDDDLDVAMLREDYERFRRAVRTDLDRERFCFQDMRDTPGYRWGYGKLRRKDTLFLREFQEDMPYMQGIFIDVFPLDPVPDNRIARKLVDAECFAVRKFLWARVGKHAASDPVKRMIYSLMDRVPEKVIKRYYLTMAARANRRKTDWVRILTFPAPFGHGGYLRRWYEDGQEVLFEGKWFPGIRDYDGYLTFKFGDYRTPPPLEQRKSHPVSAIRVIERPYE